MEGKGLPPQLRRAEPGLRSLDIGFSTWYMGLMWWQTDKPGILARLGALESDQHAIESEDTLTSHQGEISSLRTRCGELEQVSGFLREKLEALALAVGEGIQRVDRDERRIKATVARAQKKLADSGFADEGLDAEAHDLRLVDGTGGEERGVRAVPDEVAGAAEPASSIEGVTLEQLHRARGFY